MQGARAECRGKGWGAVGRALEAMARTCLSLGDACQTPDLGKAFLKPAHAPGPERPRDSRNPTPLHSETPSPAPSSIPPLSLEGLSEEGIGDPYRLPSKIPLCCSSRLSWPQVRRGVRAVCPGTQPGPRLGSAGSFWLAVACGLCVNDGRAGRIFSES